MIETNTENVHLPMQVSFADIDSDFSRLAVPAPGVPTGNGTLFVRRLIYGAGHRDLLQNPTWQQIVSILSNLDGRYDVLLEGQEAFPYMAIGGWDENYLVAVGQENAACYLCDPKRWKQEPSFIVLGGQGSWYDSDLCVGSEMAMPAIWNFAEWGTLLPSMHWLMDGMEIE